MILIWEWLIALGELLSTCKLQFQHDFRWFSVSKQIRLIIAYNVELVGQLSVNLGLSWRDLLFTHIIRVNEGSWSKVNCSKGGFCFYRAETKLWMMAKIRASSISQPAVKVTIWRHLYAQGEAIDSSKRSFKLLQLKNWQVFQYKPLKLKKLGFSRWRSFWRNWLMQRIEYIPKWDIKPRNNCLELCRWILLNRASK